MLTFSAKTWRYFDCLREMCEESEGARVSTRLSWRERKAARSALIRRTS